MSKQANNKLSKENLIIQTAHKKMAFADTLDEFIQSERKREKDALNKYYTERIKLQRIKINLVQQELDNTLNLEAELKQTQKQDLYKQKQAAKNTISKPDSKAVKLFKSKFHDINIKPKTPPKQVTVKVRVIQPKKKKVIVKEEVLDTDEYGYFKKKYEDENPLEIIPIQIKLEQIIENYQYKVPQHMSLTREMFSSALKNQEKYSTTLHAMGVNGKHDLVERILGSINEHYDGKGLARMKEFDDEYYEDEDEYENQIEDLEIVKEEVPEEIVIQKVDDIKEETKAEVKKKRVIKNWQPLSIESVEGRVFYEKLMMQDIDRKIVVPLAVDYIYFNGIDL